MPPTQKWYAHPITGICLGSHVGGRADLPEYLRDAILAEGPPEDGTQVWDGTQWTGPIPEVEPEAAEVVLEALLTTRALRPEDVAAAKEVVRQRGPGRRRKPTP